MTAEGSNTPGQPDGALKLGEGEKEGEDAKRVKEQCFRGIVSRPFPTRRQRISNRRTIYNTADVKQYSIIAKYHIV